MIRQGPYIALVVSLLIAVLVVGCGAGGTGNNDGRGGKGGAVATEEETTAPEGDRPAASLAREPVGLDVELVAPGKAYVPAGFGEGSLWAIDLPTCNDTASASASAGSASATADACALPQNTLLKRLDGQSGEVVAEIPLEGLSANVIEVAFGAGSVWVASSDISIGPPVPRGRRPEDAVLRVDPQTNRVVDRTPVYHSSGVAFGHGSVWVTSASHGTLSRIDPQSGEVVAKIEVGRGAMDVVTDEGSGAVWVASMYLPKNPGGYDSPEYSEDKNITRVDPETNRVVAETLIRPDSMYGGAIQVAVGEGAVWALSEGTTESESFLYEVDPATNEVVAEVPLGDHSSQLAVYGGAVWAMVQAENSQGETYRLARVDPRTEQTVASEIVASVEVSRVSRTSPGRLAKGGGYVWFASGEGLARVSP